MPSDTCKECASAIPAGSPGGFCAQCLLGLGLASTPDFKAEAPPAGDQDSDQLDGSAQPDRLQSDTGVTTPLFEKPGDLIGRYRLVEELGRGGCGVVYLAEQEEPVRRRVALKVIKLGMDTRQVVARFEAERQVLALMDHPNIATVLDAGTTGAGRPYFVMELVNGVRITDYCKQKHLTTRQLLDLFVQVCRAIEHAHQKGVIHRDIKPSNVLVATHDGVAVPKVIDFGIAKATQGRLTDDSIFTAFEQFIGTPAYMSPEQAQLGGSDVDTRSDIYSLGVLLYELLTGKTPFDVKELLAAGVDEIRRAIQEKEPAKPSTRLSQELKSIEIGRRTGPRPPRDVNSGDESTSVLQPLPMKQRIHQIRGDLDWIVMKCLEKDRMRRYPTANGVARDIERHLNNEAVAAGPPSNFYRFHKFVRRNRVAFAAATAVLTMLVLGLALSIWQAVRATMAEREQTRLLHAAQRAQANEKRQREKAEMEMAKSKQVASFLKTLLRGTSPVFAQGRDTELMQLILNHTVNQIHTQLTNQPEVEAELCATLAGTYEELCLFARMREVAQRSLRLARARLGEECPEVALALELVGRSLLHLGEHAQAESTQRNALALRRKLLGNAHPDVARSLIDLGSTLLILGKIAESEPLLREALAILQNLSNRGTDMVRAISLMAQLLEDQGCYTEAEPVCREALNLAMENWGNNHPAVANELMSLATLLGTQGKTAEAEAVGREGLALMRKLYGKEHRELARALPRLADVLRSQGELAEAESLAREALMIAKGLPQAQSNVGDALVILGRVLRAQHNLAEAESCSREGVAMWRKVYGNEHPTLAVSLLDLAEALYHRNKLSEAEAMVREALGMLRKLVRNEHPMVNRSLNALARITHRRGNLPQAEAAIREAVDLQRKLSATNRPDPISLDLMAAVLRDEGKLTEAEALLREALTAVGPDPSSEHPYSAMHLHHLAEVLRRKKSFPEARSLAQRAVALYRRQPNSHEKQHASAVLETVLKEMADAEGLEVFYREQVEDLRADSSPNGSELAAALTRLAKALCTAGKFSKAEPVCRESLAIRERIHTNDWHTFNARVLLGATLAVQKKLSDAEPLLLSGYEGMKQRESKIPSSEKRLLKDSLWHLVNLYEAMGRSERGAEWKRKLDQFERSQTNKPPATPSTSRPPR